MTVVERIAIIETFWTMELAISWAKRLEEFCYIFTAQELYLKVAHQRHLDDASMPFSTCEEPSIIVHRL